MQPVTEPIRFRNVQYRVHSDILYVVMCGIYTLLFQIFPVCSIKISILWAYKAFRHVEFLYET